MLVLPYIAPDHRYLYMQIELFTVTENNSNIKKPPKTLVDNVDNSIYARVKR